MKNSKSHKILGSVPESEESQRIRSPRSTSAGDDHSSQRPISSDDSLMDPKPRRAQAAY